MNDHDHHSHGGDSQNYFCQPMDGNGMSMYMSGLKSSFMNPDAPCLNLLFPSYTLDSEFKFLAGMILVSGLGLLLEALPHWRRKYIARLERVEGNEDKVQLVSSALHGCQALLGYLLMLVAMTYSIELLFSAVLGLSIGYYLFYKQRRNRFTGGNEVEPSSTTPCCEFLVEENEQMDDAIAHPLLGDNGIEESQNGLSQRRSVGSSLIES